MSYIDFTKTALAAAVARGVRRSVIPIARTLLRRRHESKVIESLNAVDVF